MNRRQFLKTVLGTATVAVVGLPALIYSPVKKFFRGHIDEVRITKGFARYTGPDMFLTENVFLTKGELIPILGDADARATKPALPSSRGRSKKPR